MRVPMMVTKMLAVALVALLSTVVPLPPGNIVVLDTTVPITAIIILVVTPVAPLATPLATAVVRRLVLVLVVATSVVEVLRVVLSATTSMGKSTLPDPTMAAWVNSGVNVSKPTSTSSEADSPSTEICTGALCEFTMKRYVRPNSRANAPESVNETLPVTSKFPAESLSILISLSQV